MTINNRATSLFIVSILLTTIPFLRFNITSEDKMQVSSYMSSVDNPLKLSGSFFLENLGQLSNPDIRFYLRQGGSAIGFGESSVFIHLYEAYEDTSAILAEWDGNELENPLQHVIARNVLMRITFEGSRQVSPVAHGELPHYNAFFLGKDPSKWRTDIRAFERITYPNLYNNIDLIYYPTPEGLKYEFLIHPGGNLDDIVLRYEGAQDIDTSPNQVSIHTTVGILQDDSIIGLQAGRNVPCIFTPRDRHSHSFACEEWDLTQDFILDPLLYSTYFGGAVGFGGGRDTPYSIAVDTNGDIYVVGETESTDFPTTLGTFDSIYNGSSDAYLVKIRPGGNGPADLLYSAYIGGDGYDQGRSVWVNSSGYVYISGRTWSADFPTTLGAFDEDLNLPVTDGFMMILLPKGNDMKDLVYSTYLGGNGNDEVKGMAIDSLGRVNLCGLTNSTDFPVTSGAYNMTLNGSYDAFLTLIQPLGGGSTDLVYSTYYGGMNGDYCYGIALDGGRAYLTGHTYGDIPTTIGAFNRTFNGGWDGLFVVINPLGTGSTDLEYATLFGGISSDTPYAIATYAGNALITGYTHSPNFPTTLGAFDTLYNVSSDGFFVQFNPAGGGANDLVYGTFFGGTKIENPVAITVDASGNALITGQTGSPEFNTTAGAFDEIKNGGEDAFMMKIVPAGGGESDLAYSTFFGGSGEDEGWGITIDSAGIVYLAVRTFMGAVPTTAGSYSETPIGSVDTVIVKLDLGPNTPPIANAGLDQSSTRNVTVFLDGSDSQDPDRVPLRYRWALESGPGSVTIINSTKVMASFIPDLLGTYTFNLTVTDGDRAVDYDLVNIYISNIPPIAQLTTIPTSLRTGETATLNASASYDPDGEIVLYNFTFGDGSWTEDTIGTVTHLWTTANIYQVNVTVIDGDGASDTDTITMTVVPNQSPVADAGPDATYSKNQTIILNGSASYDPELDPITFEWIQITGSPVSIVNKTSITPSVFIPLSGVYSFQLWVNDSLSGSGSDTVQVTMTNTAPLADAGSDLMVPRNVLVALDGRGSNDKDNDMLSFIWAQTAGPLVILLNANTPVATFTPTVLGTYIFNLTVDDGDGGSHTDTTIVTVFNHAPIIITTTPESSEVTILAGEELLFVVVAIDLDNDPITYSWTINDILQSNINSTYSFISLEAGIYFANITVSDGNLIDSYSWSIIVNEPGSATPQQSTLSYILIGIVTAIIIGIGLLFLWRRRRRKASSVELVTSKDDK